MPKKFDQVSESGRPRPNLDHALSSSGQGIELLQASGSYVVNADEIKNMERKINVEIDMKFLVKSRHSINGYHG